MNTAEPSAAFRKFLESWRQAFGQVLTEGGLKATKVEFLDSKACAGHAETNASDKSYRLTVSGGGALRGALRFVTSEAEALRLSLRLMPNAASEASQFSDKQRDAVTEMISRAAGKVIANWGKDRVQFKISTTVPAESDGLYGGLRISAENLEPLLILLLASADFAESASAIEKPEPTGNPKQASTGAAVTTNPSTSNPPAGAGSNLGLLFDVQLDATIRFGGRQLLLRDILTLSPGSVVELDRQVGEPAELVVAGRVVARGDVVVVDGNFGLRVTELCNAGSAVANPTAS